MMDDDVLGPDRRKTIAAEIADALGKARLEGREDQVGPVIDNQLGEIAPSR
jgi:hypothetical protein